METSLCRGHYSLVWWDGSYARVCGTSLDKSRSAVQFRTVGAFVPRAFVSLSLSFSVYDEIDDEPSVDQLTRDTGIELCMYFLGLPVNIDAACSRSCVKEHASASLSSIQTLEKYVCTLCSQGRVVSCSKTRSCETFFPFAIFGFTLFSRNIRDTPLQLEKMSSTPVETIIRSRKITGTKAFVICCEQ